MFSRKQEKKKRFLVYSNLEETAEILL
jgi:hypothetical protein